MIWFDKYSRGGHRIGVGRDTPGDVVQVKSYRDVIEEYRVHPEPKSLDAQGLPCDRASTGRLSRRPVELGSLTCVGKESNQLEFVALGLVHDRAEVQEAHPMPQRSSWDLIYLPALRRVPLKRLKALTDLGSRVTRYYWKGQRRPSPEVEAVLQAEALRWAQAALRDEHLSPEDQEVARRVVTCQPGRWVTRIRQPVRRRRRGVIRTE